MQTLGAIAMWGGLLLAFVGGLFFIIAAFRESILWGLGVIFLPFVSLVFLVLHWQRAKSSFFLQLYGIGFVLLGMIAFQARLPTMH